ncbi:MAG TPA: hypothetical protein VMJ65_20185, partial [Solirubrobacteraceae bacterium]|nr:hypothetical protein [Solirubrobacteraceae bacterium]
MPRDQPANLVGPALIPQPSRAVKGMKASACDLWVVSDVVQPSSVGYDGFPSAVQQMAYAIDLTSDARRMSEACTNIAQQPIGKASGVGLLAAYVRGIKVDWTEQMGSHQSKLATSPYQRRPGRPTSSSVRS